MTAQTAALAQLGQEPVRFLDDAGNWDPSSTAAAYEQELADLTLADKQQWYLDMLVTRAFDQEGTNLQRQGQMALWVPSLGQEGCQVGIAHAAEPQDYIFPAYREHAVCRVRGVELTDIGKVFRGVANAGWDPHDPKNGNVHPYTLVLGAQAQHASGYALGQVLDAKQRAGSTLLDPAEPGTATGEATLVFYGDGTSSQGDANEAMIFAASYQTPVLFVVQNNQWAISVPVARQSRTPIYLRALGFGLTATQLDGNDPLAAYAVARKYLRDARAGKGPHYIEALTYRQGAHTTSDDPTRYRDASEVQQWQQRDPLQRFEKYLRSLGVGDDFFEQATATAKAYALHTRETLLALDAPHPDSMFAHVYAGAHSTVDYQRQWLAQYEASFEQEGQQ